MKRYTEEVINYLKSNEIFVFGSNEGGQHYGGAAMAAFCYFGAEWGLPFGLSGRTFAIPTLTKDYKKLDKESLKSYIKKFFEFVKENKQYTFILTKIGCGIAGFTTNEIKDIIWDVVGENMPINVVYPIEFEK